MSQQIKTKVGRLHFLHQLLQQKVLSLLEIQLQYRLSGWQKSIRQIQRDLKDWNRSIWAKLSTIKFSEIPFL